MINFTSYRPGITEQLIFVNLLLVAMFATMSMLMVYSFGEVERLVNKTVSTDMQMNLTSAGVLRDLTGIFSQVSHLQSNFIKNEQELKTQGPQLVTATEKLAVISSNQRLSDPVLEYADQVQKIFAICDQINISIRNIEQLELQQRKESEALEGTISDTKIRLVLKGHDPVIMDQLMSLTINLQYSLQDISLFFFRTISDKSSAKDPNRLKQLLAKIDDVSLVLQALTASEPQIAAFSPRINASIKVYRFEIEHFFTMQEELEGQAGQLESSKEKVIDVMQSIDRELSASTRGVGQHVHEIMISSRRNLVLTAVVMALFSAIVTSLLIYLKVHRPMVLIKKGIEHFAAGHLESTINLNRHDEWDIIEKALNTMAGALDRSYRELEHHHDQLEMMVKDRTSELTLAKDQAELANRAKSDFLSSMSHELRTPLNAILGYAQILTHQNSLSENQRHQIGIMRNSGEHLLSLINDLLDLGKIEANKMDLEDVVFNLPFLIDQVFNLNKLQAEKKGLSFRYEEATELPQHVHGDERKLRQILLNLLSNGVKYTQQGSVTMRVSYNLKGDGLFHCEVADTGIGIPSDKIASIFEPFTQLATDWHSREGTGLGLNITERLLKLMQGKIGVESTFGKGSTFRMEVSLPVVLNNDLELKNAEKRVTGYRGERKRILVVDDVLGNSELLVSLLEPLGFQVDTAQNGKEALLQASRQQPDLVVLDLVMPEMDGIEAARIFRQNRDLAAVKIIGASATVTESTRKEEFVALCDDFVLKPIHINLLLEKIGRLLRIDWETLSPLTAMHKNRQKSEKAEDTFAIPPLALMEELYELAKLGDMMKIEAWAAALEDSHGEYHSFAERLQQLARGFKAKAILSLVEQCQREGK